MTKKELIEKLEELKVPDNATIYLYEDGDLEIVTYDPSLNEVELNNF